VNESPLPLWAYALPLLAVALAVAAYPDLPARMATHLGSDLRPDAWMPKGAALAVHIGSMVLFLALWHVLWRIDPRRSNYTDFWPTYRLVGGLLQGFLLVLFAWSVGRNLGVTVASPAVVPAAVGVLFVLLMNRLPRLRPNWWIGVRTPWTLSDEDVWRRTHRLAGEAGVVAGFLLITAALVLRPAATAVATGVVVGLWAVLSACASYVFYQRRPRA
jgi:uncharacterized membrane protein